MRHWLVWGHWLVFVSEGVGLSPSFILAAYFASSSSPIILNLLTFFSLGILKVPWDSLVSISRLWISMSIFLTAYSMSNFSPNTTQLLSYICLTRAARSSLLMADTSGISPTLALTEPGTPMVAVTGRSDTRGVGGWGDSYPLPCTLR